MAFRSAPEIYYSQALVACAGVTLAAVATSIGVAVRGGVVQAEGDLDFRGTLGVSKEAPVGFRSIRLTFKLDAEATGEQMESLANLTRAVLCSISNLGQRMPIEATYNSGNVRNTINAPSGANKQHKCTLSEVATGCKVNAQMCLSQLDSSSRFTDVPIDVTSGDSQAMDARNFKLPDHWVVAGLITVETS